MDLPRDNSADIVKQALSFRRPGRLPVYDPGLDGLVPEWRRRGHAGVDAHIEDNYWSDLHVAVALEQFFPSRMGERAREGECVLRDDGWGRVVRTREGAEFCEPVERLLRSPTDLDHITFEPADLDLRYTDFLRDVNRHRRKGKAVFVKIGGPFMRSCFFRGETEFLLDLAGDPAFARALVEKVGGHLLQIGLESLRRARAHPFGVWIYDDMCSRTAPMFSPRTFENVFMPVYAAMVSTLKKAGARWVILHCDGNLLPLLDLVVETGIDGINPVEHAAGMDVVRLIEKYYGRLRFIGGVCNTHVLPGGDPGAIRRHVEAIVDAGANGGLIIGTHSIGSDVSLEAYELYREIVATRGRYS